MRMNICLQLLLKKVFSIYHDRAPVKIRHKTAACFWCVGNGNCASLANVDFLYRNLQYRGGHLGNEKGSHINNR